MAKVRVRYFGMLREIVGKREERCDINDSYGVDKLIKLLSEKHGVGFSEFLFDQRGKLRDGLAFAVNGDTTDSKHLSKMTCENVHEFVILPPISGG